MNIIIIREEEIKEDGTVLISDRRAEHVKTILKSEPGHTVRVGILNGSLGTGAIEEITDDHVQMTCTFNGAPTPSAEIDLILAMPRPKVMQRLFATLASLGVRRIFLTNAKKVEKFYFDTHILEPKHYEPVLIEGLEQAGATQLPEVRIIRQFKHFIEDELDELFPTGDRFIAHPAPEPDTQMIKTCTAPAVLALGPEGGWMPHELDLFEQNRFQSISLGNRTLKTDTACIALISVLKHISLSR